VIDVRKKVAQGVESALEVLRRPNRIYHQYTNIRQTKLDLLLDKGGIVRHALLCTSLVGSG